MSHVTIEIILKSVRERERERESSVLKAYRELMVVNVTVGSSSLLCSAHAWLRLLCCYAVIRERERERERDFRTAWLRLQCCNAVIRGCNAVIRGCNAAG